MARGSAAVGAVEIANAVVLVTIGPDRRLLDRRRVALTGAGLPTHPHHHEGSWAVGRYLATPGARRLSLAEAVALVERVRRAATQGARDALETLARDVGDPIGTVAIRRCPDLPATVEERIADNRAQTQADSVMYRQALAEAAEQRGWSVAWYDRAAVLRDAEELASVLRDMGREVGPPWQAAHRLAAAAAIAVDRPAGARARR